MEKISSLEEKIELKDLDTSKRNYEQILTDKILSLELKIDQLRV